MPQESEKPSANRRPERGDEANQRLVSVIWRWWLPLALFLGAILYLLWAWSSGLFTPIVSDDINQNRNNTVLPALGENIQLRQTFLPGRDGLKEIELIVARPPDGAESGRLEMQLLDDSGQIIASREIESKELVHNEVISLRFPHQAHSAGQMYTLILGGTANNNVSVWGYDLDVHAGGELTLIGGETAAQDLRFITRYQLSLFRALSSVIESISTNIGLIILSVLLMLLPGFILLLAGDHWLPTLDPAAWLGLALAAGIALWPVLWLWLTVIGGRWRPWSLWLVFVIGWLTVLLLLLLRFRRRAAADGPQEDSTRQRNVIQWRSTRLKWVHLVLLLILFLALAVRLLAVRDLAFPPWVDSSRHALITAVMSKSGKAMPDYAPYLEINRFPYHFGFHTLSAGVSQMMNPPLPDLLLIMGQLINALLPLAAFAGVYIMVRRSGVALLTAFLIAIPFFFPAYYATWGRMTQLTAMLVLAAALSMTWQLIRGSRCWQKSWWLVSILVAGLFLIHFRVFLFYLLFAALIWLISRGRNGRWLALAGLLTAVFVAPHAIRLYLETGAATGGGSIAGYNDFPFGYVSIGWERGFLLAAAAAILLVVVAALRGKSWAWLPLSLAAWSGMLAVMLSGQRLSLPEIRLLNLNSAYISAFLPLSFILAVAAGQLWRWLSQWRNLQIGGAIIAGALLTAALIFGVGQQIVILNPVTILARPQDLEGLNWMEENLDDSSLVAVNSWQWLGQTWTGADGGAWIVPLTGLNSTTPPADYIYNRSLAQDVITFNTYVQSVPDWSDPTAVDWLKEQGVTHLYVGAKGGTFDPAFLAKNPSLQMVYARDGVFIFAVIGQ